MSRVKLRANVHNGERFSARAIQAPRGTGAISLNGAAARKDEARRHKPRIVLLGEGNRIAQVRQL